MRRSTVSVLMALSAVLALAACGGSTESSGSTTTSPGGTTSTMTAPVQLSGQVNANGEQDLTAQGATPTLRIEANDFSFSPTYVKVRGGTTVTVELRNAGAVEHTFTIDAPAIDQDLRPGQSATVRVAIPREGVVQFHCRFHGGMGMQGAFYTTTGTTGSASGAGSPATSVRGPGY